nr:MAG TPA: hypothetical protein [Caudoviricetes sp.]
MGENARNRTKSGKFQIIQRNNENKKSRKN